MGYERTLLTRWTRRDWLAVAVIALTTTFLVGTSIMILSTGAQIESEVETLDALETAGFADEPAAEAGGGDVTLPVAEATTANGSDVLVVGLPEATVVLNSSFGNATLANPPPDGVVEHGVANRSAVRLSGASGNATLEVREAPNRSVLPDRWYSARQATVRELGRTGQFRVRTDATRNATNASGLPEEGTLLLGTPGFLITGGGEIVELLGLITLGSGLLVGVTVYSVTRMTVRDRRRSLFVVRATGGTRTRLVGLFGVRAALLTAVGAAFGYALGIILINAVITVSTYYGTLTTVDVSGTATDSLVLGVILVTLLAIGLVAGALSVVRTATAPPASLRGTGASVAGSNGIAARIREALGVELIGLRTVVPMTAALTVLITIVVVSVSLGLTLAPLAGATDGVVMSSGASYPLQSQVDEDLVQSFRAAGIPASPEVLLPQVRDGQPYVMRGVNYSAYGEISDVRMTAGREPTRNDEAVIGEGLARTLDVGVGDTITVGGGTAFGIDRVTVVGRFSGPGYLDDQLLVSLGTAKQLANIPEGSVQMIRTTGIEEPPGVGDETQTPSPSPSPSPTASPTPSPSPSPADIVVTDVSVPDTGVVNRDVPIDVTVANRGGRAGSLTLTVPVNGSDNETTVTVDAGQERTVTLTAVFNATGTYNLTVGDADTSIRVVEPSVDIVVTGVSIQETGLVNRSVPVEVTLENRGTVAGNRTPSVPVNDTTEETTVTVRSGQTRTVTLSAVFRSIGVYNITVGGIDSRIEIVEPTPADIAVTNISFPDRAFTGEEIPVNVTLENRGDLAGNRTLSVPVNGTDNETTVTVQGRDTRTVTLIAVYQTPGVYNLTIDSIDSESRTEDTRVVTLTAVYRTPGVSDDTVGDVHSGIEVVEPAPANISVTGVAVPETAVPNTSIPIEVTLKNYGDIEGNQTLTVPVNGTENATTVTVEGGDTHTVTLTAAFRTPGVYNITVGGISSDIEIVDPGANIVVTNVTVPERARTDEPIPVNVTLRNRGDLEGTRTISVPVNGTDNDTTVTVEGRGERTVTLTAAYRTEGTYTLTIGDVGSVVRVSELLPADVVVTNSSVPALWGVDTGIPVEVTLENRGDVPGNLTLEVPFDGTTRETTVRINGSQELTLTTNASFRTPGEYTLTLGREDARIRIVDPANVSLSPLPDRAPPGATLLVTARDGTGAVVPGLRVRLGEESTRTAGNGTARVRIPGDPGQHRLESVIGEQVVHNRSLEVRADAERSLVVALEARPEQVEFPAGPEVTMTAHNPWNVTIRREVVIKREGESVFRRTVELGPGEETTTTTSVEPATEGGTQLVQVLSGEDVLAEATFTVEISDRLLAILARSGLYEPGTGLVRSLEALVGNFQVLQGTLAVLAVLVGVGNTVTVVIQATHARRRTIGIQRTTGASPRDVIRTIVGDGLRIGTMASAVGVVSAYAGLTVLVRVGYSVIFGVRISPLLSPWLVLVVLMSALLIVAVSSMIAAWWVVRVSPGALVTTSTRRVPERDDAQGSNGPGVE
jgi:ABC-type lipoprotein release transport system permease subunit